MTREELSKNIKVLFGSQIGALKMASKALPINYQNLKSMLAGKRPVPGWLDERFSALFALAQITSPPTNLSEYIDRTDQCHEALDPHISDLASRAQAVGWSEAEVCAALTSWAVKRIAHTPRMSGDEAFGRAQSI